jgi:hypothetical protein
MDSKEGMPLAISRIVERGVKRDQFGVDLNFTREGVSRMALTPK